MAFKGFCHGVLQRNYRKNDLAWSFSYNSFVKLSIYKMIHLYYGSYQLPMDPKLISLMKELHCNLQDIIFCETKKIFRKKRGLVFCMDFLPTKYQTSFPQTKKLSCKVVFICCLYFICIILLTDNSCVLV